MKIKVIFFSQNSGRRIIQSSVGKNQKNPNNLIEFKEWLGNASEHAKWYYPRAGLRYNGQELARKHTQPCRAAHISWRWRGLQSSHSSAGDGCEKCDLGSNTHSLCLSVKWGATARYHKNTSAETPNFSPKQASGLSRVSAECKAMLLVCGDWVIPIQLASDQKWCGND